MLEILSSLRGLQNHKQLAHLILAARLPSQQRPAVSGLTPTFLSLCQRVLRPQEHAHNSFLAPRLLQLYSGRRAWCSNLLAVTIRSINSNERRDSCSGNRKLPPTNSVSGFQILMFSINQALPIRRHVPLSRAVITFGC